jgi:hypothetical protein
VRNRQSGQVRAGAAEEAVQQLARQIHQRREWDAQILDDFYATSSHADGRPGSKAGSRPGSTGTTVAERTLHLHDSCIRVMQQLNH